MRNILIGIAIIWAIGTAAVPALQNWDMAGSNGASSSAVAAMGIE